MSIATNRIRFDGIHQGVAGRKERKDFMVFFFRPDELKYFIQIEENPEGSAGTDSKINAKVREGFPAKHYP